MERAARLIGMRKVMTTSRAFSAFMVLLGTGWIMLGIHTRRIPWFTHEFWILACGLCGGAAFALARYRTLFALRAYAWFSVAIGGLRSLAYISNNAGGPAAVWYIYSITVWGGYLLVRDQYWKGQT